MSRVLCSSAAVAALVLLLMYSFMDFKGPSLHPTQTGRVILSRGSLRHLRKLIQPEPLALAAPQAGGPRRHLLEDYTQCPTWPSGADCCSQLTSCDIIKVTVSLEPLVTLDVCLGTPTLTPVACECYTTTEYKYCESPILGLCILSAVKTGTYNTPYTGGTCDNAVNNDPIIVGFDGKQFHFDELGDWNMLSEGSGWQVHTTLTGAQVEAGESVPQEKSWTTSVRVISPTGDKVSCDLAGLRPNTTRPTMTATPVGGAPISMTPTNSVMELGDITAMAVSTSYPSQPYLTGCHIVTPKIDILVYQVDGWDQAQKFPDLEGWAAPFTWLNMDIKLLDRLAAPVTGIMGATYPKSALAPQPTDDTVALRAGETGRTTPIIEAHIEGEPVGLARQQRRLAGEDFGPAADGGHQPGAE